MPQAPHNSLYPMNGGAAPSTISQPEIGAYPYATVGLPSQLVQPDQFGGRIPSGSQTCTFNPFGPLDANLSPQPSCSNVQRPGSVPVLSGGALQDGECVLASQRILYFGGEEVPLRTLGTVTATDPHIGVDWIGFVALTKAFARPDQLDRPGTLQGKLIAVKGLQSKEPDIRCLSGVMGMARMVPCRDVIEQNFVLPPCGKGYIVSSDHSSNICLEALPAGSAVLSPCDGKKAQLFKLGLRDRQLEATVGEHTFCYDLAGKTGDELVGKPCGATSTVFSFAERDTIMKSWA